MPGQAHLSRRRKLEFKRNGFIVLEDALDPDVCAAAREVLARIVDEDPTDPASIAARDGDHDEIFHRNSASQAATRMTPADVEPFESLFRSIYPYASALVGEDLLAPPAEPPMRYCLHGGHLLASRHRDDPVVDHDGAIGPILQYPDNRSDDLGTFDYAAQRHVDGGTGPYAVDAEDVTYLPFTIAAAVYFDRVEPRGGGFTVWPGSHRRTAEYFAEHSYHDYVTSDVDVLADLDLGPALEIVGPPGTLVLWHHNLAHGAAPNRSERIRMAGFQRIARRDMPTIGESGLADPWLQYPALLELEPTIHESYR